MADQSIKTDCVMPITAWYMVAASRDKKMATLEESRLVQSIVTLPRSKPESQEQDGGSVVVSDCMGGLSL